MSNLEENKNFKGSLNEFIRIITDSMYDIYGIRDDKITERLVRYYVTKSVIPRPVREGKEVFYSYEHIIKFLYARKQIIDGWPMGKFREIIKYEENEYFENFLNNFSQSDNNYDSMSLINEFKSENRYSSDRKFRSKSNPLRYKNRVDIPNLQEALIAIDANLGNVVRQEFTVFTLASWLVLQIENDKLSGMTYELSKKIGEAISSALVERNPMTSEQLQKEFTQYKENIELNYKNEKLLMENEILRQRIEAEKKEKIITEDSKFTEIESLKNKIEIEKEQLEREIKVRMETEQNQIKNEMLETVKLKLKEVENVKNHIENYCKEARINVEDLSEQSRVFIGASLNKFRDINVVDLKNLKEEEQEILISYMQSTQEFMNEFLSELDNKINKQSEIISKNENELNMLLTQLEQITRSY